MSPAPLDRRSPWTDAHAGAEFTFECVLPWSGSYYAPPETSPDGQLLQAMSVPCSPVSGCSAAPPFAPPRASNVSLRVLIADDQSSNRKLMQLALQRSCGGESWEYETAVTAEDAADRVEAALRGKGGAEPFNLVLMDEIFGDGEVMRGSDAIQRIRRHEAKLAAAVQSSSSAKAPPALVIISCTGNAAYEAELLKGCGADDVWPKPFPARTQT